MAGSADPTPCLADQLAATPAASPHGGARRVRRGGIAARSGRSLSAHLLVGFGTPRGSGRGHGPAHSRPSRSMARVCISRACGAAPAASGCCHVGTVARTRRFAGPASAPCGADARFALDGIQGGAMTRRSWQERLPTNFWLFLATVLAAAVLASTAQARVGGGQSYGGGGGSGGSSSGDGWAGLLWLLLRLLFELNFQHPAIGIPVDLVLVGAIAVWWYSSHNAPPAFSFSSTRSDEIEPRLRAVREDVWDGIREFDPNFSQILFADF